jgi:uncharacterized membrane protein YedE/YeeE
MRPTRWSTLVVVAIVSGGVSYLITRSWFDYVPTPSVYLPLWLAVLAIAELYLAAMTRARLAGRSGTRPVDPLVVARYVALAKASAVVGSLATGVYAGFLGWVIRLDTPTANHDTTTAAFGMGLAVLLTVAALVLEYACRVPKRDDDDRRGDDDSAGR